MLLIKFRVYAVAACAAWLLAIAAAFWAIANYQFRAGASGATPLARELSIDEPAGNVRPLLMLFLHPRCPCSRATVQQLAQILDRRGGSLDAKIIFVIPDGSAAEFAQSELWEAAGKLPGAERLIDIDGSLAERYGAQTSGYVVLYGSAGQLLFGGGITGSRGQVGEGVAGQALCAALDEPGGRPVYSPVFGCPLQSGAAKVVTIDGP